MTKDEFYNQWLKCFAADISQMDLEKYVVSTGNLIWHIFSWELKDRNDYRSGMAAREAFDRMEKEDAMYLE